MSKKPENYKRYRDDTIDVCHNSSEKEQEEVTKWMNENIYKDKIVFKTESIGEEINSLDTKTVDKDHKAGDEDRFLLIPSMYSKKTDTHQYLSPKSCHPKHIAENIPVMVANGCRTNCSNNIRDDLLFKDALIQYKAFLLKSGYWYCKI